MKFEAIENKKVEIKVNNNTYLRHAIKTHYVQIGESYIDLIEKYVKDIYEKDDILSISEKVISLCQKRIVYKKDLKVGFLAKFLSKFAMKTDAGVGVSNIYKMQFAINMCGKLKVIWAAICSAVGKLFKKKGIFYKIVGQEVSGLDGFYGHIFSDYEDFGIRIPENPTGVCNEIFDKTGVKCMIVDANDLDVEILGKSNNISLSEETLKKIIKDNPAGQSKTLTPFILIRMEKKKTTKKKKQSNKKKISD